MAPFSENIYPPTQPRKTAGYHHKQGRDTPKDTPARLPTLRVAAAARHTHVLDYLAVEVVLRLDHMANVDPAVVAGVGRIMVSGGWVRGMRGRLIHVNSSNLLAAPPGD